MKQHPPYSRVVLLSLVAASFALGHWAPARLSRWAQPSRGARCVRWDGEPAAAGSIEAVTAAHPVAGIEGSAAAGKSSSGKHAAASTGGAAVVAAAWADGAVQRTMGRGAPRVRTVMPGNRRIKPPPSLS